MFVFQKKNVFICFGEKPNFLKYYSIDNLFKMSINNPTLDELLSSPIGSKWSAGNSRMSYTQEIQQMMYAFGDYEKPLYESAQLIESIVHNQMTTLLSEANRIAQIRGSRVLGIEELLFLMRSDRTKLCRLVKHLSAKDSKQRLESELKLGTIDDNEVYDNETNNEENNNLEDLSGVASNSDELTAKPPQQTKRVKLCYDFLSSIDSLGTLLVVFDDNFIDNIKQERDMRTDRMSNNMSESNYLKFSECRRISFANKSRPTKFRDWLLKESTIEIKPNALALEVLQYLAKETVSQIVDLSLLVKQDLERDICDPLTSLLPHKILRQDFPHSNQNSGTASDSEEMFNSYPSPNSPFFMSSQSKSLSKIPLINTIDGQKSKKRKRGDNSKLSFEAHSYCITPNHIREAVRRYYSFSGPFAKTSNQSSIPLKKLLCF